MAGFIDSDGNKPNNNRFKIDIPKKSSNGNIFFNILKGLSNYGMNYKKIISNSRAAGKYEDPNVITNDINDVSIFNNAASVALGNMLDTKNVAALDTSYINKRYIIRDYSAKPQLQNFIDIICYDSIKYGHTNSFCHPTDLNGDYSDEVKLELFTTFNEIYDLLKFNESRRAWHLFRRFLIDGYLALEIIYDDNMSKIIGFKELDPITLLPNYDFESGAIIWTQYANNPGITRILLDSQIIFLSYSTIDNIANVSYVEPLIMNYNKLKQLEDALYIWQITNSRNYKKFTVPLDGFQSKKREEELFKIMSKFKEDIRMDSTTGQVTINSDPNIGYNKEYWFQAEGSNVEQIKQDGYDMNEDGLLKWLDAKLKEITKIPYSRFNKDTGGGFVYTQEADITREEEHYSNVINSIRASWNEILLKPLYIQMVLKFPYLKNDPLFKNKINIEYDDDNKFKRTVELKNLNSQATIFNTFKDFKRQIGDKEIPMFADEFIIKKIFGFTDDELKYNDELLIKQMAKYKRLSGIMDKVGGSSQSSEGGESEETTSTSEEGNENLL